MDVEDHVYLQISDIVAGKCFKLYPYGQSYMLVDWYAPTDTKGFKSTQHFLVNLNSGLVIQNTDDKKKMAHFLNTWRAVEVRLMASAIRKMKEPNDEDLS